LSTNFDEIFRVVQGCITRKNTVRFWWLSGSQSGSRNFKGNFDNCGTVSIVTTRDMRIGNFRSNRISNRIRGVVIYMFNADCHVGVVYLIMCKPTTLLHATLYVLHFCLYFFNLLYCLNDWTCAIINRHSLAVAYIDFQKVFDSVCHNKLLVRFASLSIAGNLLE